MTLDIITIGRSSIDLYGGRLENMRSFDKYIGGSPTNIAIGIATMAETATRSMTGARTGRLGEV